MIEEARGFEQKCAGFVQATGPISEKELNRLSRIASPHLPVGGGEYGPGREEIQALRYGLPVLTGGRLTASQVFPDGDDGFVVSDAEEAAREAAGRFVSCQRLPTMSEIVRSESRSSTGRPTSLGPARA